MRSVDGGRDRGQEKVVVLDATWTERLAEYFFWSLSPLVPFVLFHVLLVRVFAFEYIVL